MSGWRRPTQITVEQRLERDRVDPNLVWEKATGMDPEDVRESGPPCRGTHDISTDNCGVNSQHALVVKRRECGIRMLYVPVKGSSGDSRKPTPLDKKAHLQRPEFWRQKGEHYDVATPRPEPKAKATPDLRAKGPQQKPRGSADPPASASAREDSSGTWEMPDDTNPTWNGDPDTWDTYRAGVESALATRKIMEEHARLEAEINATKPTWDGEAETWESFSLEMKNWLDAHKETLDQLKRSRQSRSSSRMTSGSATPATFRRRQE